MRQLSRIWNPNFEAELKLQKIEPICLYLKIYRTTAEFVLLCGDLHSHNFNLPVLIFIRNGLSDGLAFLGNLLFFVFISQLFLNSLGKWPQLFLKITQLTHSAHLSLTCDLEHSFELLKVIFRLMHCHNVGCLRSISL